jgi:hypothetical protein
MKAARGRRRTPQRLRREINFARSAMEYGGVPAPLSSRVAAYPTNLLV